MKIGIIVYSQTGNTYSVAERLKEQLVKMKHKVELIRLETTEELKPNTKDIKFKELPNLDKYDIILFGAPVQAFSLCLPMKIYLEQISSLNGKEVGCFTTEAFPYPWMGGNNAVKKMKKICQDKGATVYGTGVVNWGRKNREELIQGVLNNLSK